MAAIESANGSSLTSSGSLSLKLKGADSPYQLKLSISTSSSSADSFDPIASSLKAQGTVLKASAQELDQAALIVQDASSAIDEIATLTSEIASYADLASVSTTSSRQRDALSNEATLAAQRISDIASSGTVQGQNVFNGSYSSVNVPSGARSSDTATLSIPNLTNLTLGVSGYTSPGFDLTTSESATTALTSIDTLAYQVEERSVGVVTNANALSSRSDLASSASEISLASASPAEPAGAKVVTAEPVDLAIQRYGESTALLDQTFSLVSSVA